jgi:UDP-N-acetylglucosamine 2-epimerase (non-hydrolysing)
VGNFMVRKRILSIFGTRPEAIKMAPVIKKLEEKSNITSIVAVTAQHREMLDQVLELFSIKPDFDLNIMKPGQDLFDVTVNSLLGLKDIINRAKPDLILVHGDTTTCFTGAVAGLYCQIPVAHVEAGLRTGNMYAPFPEEANRSLVGKIASFHFSPTENSRNNLIKEGIDPKKILVTGNTVIDALLDVQKKLPDYNPYDWAPKLPRNLIDNITQSESKIILITGHRRESFGEGFKNICSALIQLAKSNSDWLLIYPVHLNPNVQKPVNELLKKIDNIHLISPQDYLPFVWLLSQCDLVITDSGGIQEEAPSLGKPVLVTRNVTERPEAVEAGTVRLVGTSIDKIVQNTVDILTNESTYLKMSNCHNPYGDGMASKRIIAYIEENIIGL